MSGRRVRFEGRYIRPSPSPPLGSTEPQRPRSDESQQESHIATHLALEERQVHPILASSHSLLLQYDLSLPPSTAKIHPSISPSVLSDSAARPPMSKIGIIHRHLPWRLSLVPQRGHTFLTVGDVLEGLYRILRLGVLEGEFMRIPTTERQIRVKDAYKRRCKRIMDATAHEMEKAKGVKRVDFLCGMVVFTGFARRSDSPDVWELHTRWTASTNRYSDDYTHHLMPGSFDKEKE